MVNLTEIEKRKDIENWKTTKEVLEGFKNAGFEISRTYLIDITTKLQLKEKGLVHVGKIDTNAGIRKTNLYSEEAIKEIMIEVKKIIEYNRETHTKHNGWLKIKEVIEYLKPKIEMTSRWLRQLINDLGLEGEGLVVRNYEIRNKKQGGELLIHLEGLKRIIAYTDKTKDSQRELLQEYVKEGYLFAPDLPLIKKIELLTDAIKEDVNRYYELQEVKENQQRLENKLNNLNVRQYMLEDTIDNIHRKVDKMSTELEKPTPEIIKRFQGLQQKYFELIGIRPHKRLRKIFPFAYGLGNKAKLYEDYSKEQMLLMIDWLDSEIKKITCQMSLKEYYKEESRS